MNKLNGAAQRKPVDETAELDWRAELFRQALQTADLLEEIQANPNLYDWTALFSIRKQMMDGLTFAALLEEPAVRAKIIDMIYDLRKLRRPEDL